MYQILSDNPKQLKLVLKNCLYCNRYALGLTNYIGYWHYRQNNSNSNEHRTLHQNFKNHSQQIILYSNTQFSMLIALTPSWKQFFTDTLLHLHCTVQSRSCGPPSLSYEHLLTAVHNSLSACGQKTALSSCWTLVLYVTYIFLEYSLCCS
jgi:hypothetical protein